MKIHTSPTTIHSSNYLEHACFKGLTKSQINYAKEQFKKFDEDKIPYGIIRKVALDTK